MCNTLIDTFNGSNIKPKILDGDDKYEVLGYNRIFCKGFCITGPNLIPLGFTFIIYFGFFTVFALFSIPWFIDRNYYFIPIYNTLVFALTILFLFLTAFRDPGIIPRQKVPKLVLGENPPIPVEHSPKNMFTSIIKSSNMNIRYCKTCNIYRPPRASHCKSCGNCVERFDHHCTWLANCIGRRNYKHFYLFMLTSIIYCLSIIMSSIYKIVLIAIPLIEQEDPDWIVKLLQESWESIAIIILGITPTMMIGLLLFEHTKMVYSNKTTFDIYINNWENVLNPFDRGPWGNIKEIILSSTPKSQVDWRDPQLCEISSDLPIASKNYYHNHSEIIEHLSQIERTLNQNPELINDVEYFLKNLIPQPNVSPTNTSIPTYSNDRSLGYNTQTTTPTHLQQEGA